MLTNEVELVSTEIVPKDLCVQTMTSQVDLGVDTSYVVTGFKREYAIVGDAYFATVTAGDTPAWLLDLINNIIDNSPNHRNSIQNICNLICYFFSRNKRRLYYCDSGY